MGQSPSTHHAGAFPAQISAPLRPKSRSERHNDILYRRRPSDPASAEATRVARLLAEEKLTALSPRAQLVIRDPLAPQLADAPVPARGGLNISLPGAHGVKLAGLGSPRTMDASKIPDGARVMYDTAGVGAKPSLYEYRPAASSQQDLGLRLDTGLASQPLGRSASLGAMGRYSIDAGSSFIPDRTAPPVPSRQQSGASYSSIPPGPLMPKSPVTAVYRHEPSLASHLNSSELELESLSDLFAKDDNELVHSPAPESACDSPYAGVGTPHSHWSESSAGTRTPPVPFATFRNSLQFAATASKRHSTQSTNRYSNLFLGRAPTPSSPPEFADVPRFAPHSAPAKAATSWGLHLPKKKQPAKKRAQIVVVGAERMASNRYSMLKASADARRAGAKLLPVEGDQEGAVLVPAPRRGSLAPGGRRRSSGTSAASTVRRPSVAATAVGSGSGSGPSSRRESEAHEVLRSASISTEAGRLGNFVAATPELAFASPDARLFEHRTSISAMPVTVAGLPAGHPANHHARFKDFNAKLVALSAPSRDAPVPASGPVAPPRIARGSLSSGDRRRPSTIVISNTPRRSLQDSTPLSEQPGTPTRKLSNYRLSIAEARPIEEEDQPVSPASYASPATPAHGRTGRQSITTVDSGSRRLSVVSRKMSFPHSVSHDSGASPGERPGSYFQASRPAEPSPALAVQAGAAAELVASAQGGGAISWGTYSLFSAQEGPDARGAVDFYGGACLAEGEDVAPEDLVEPEPVPVLAVRPLRINSRRSVHVPAPLDLLAAAAGAMAAAASPASHPSDASTPSTGSFSSIGSVESGCLPLTPQRPELGHAAAIHVDLTGASAHAKLACAGSPPTSISPSAATFTMDDLLVPNSPDPSLPPGYLSGAPTVTISSSSPPHAALKLQAKPAPIETELFEPIPAPLPSASRQRAPKPVFAEGFRLAPKPGLRPASPTRKPAMVSPMSMPSMTAYFEDDAESEPELPAFMLTAKQLREEEEAERRAWEEGEQLLLELTHQSFAPAAALPIPASQTTPPRHRSMAGLGVAASRQSSLASAARRDTHPTYASPSLGRAANESGSGLGALVQPHGKPARAVDASRAKEREVVAGPVVRLGAASKRGFDKGEIRGWLEGARKEGVQV